MTREIVLERDPLAKPRVRRVDGEGLVAEVNGATPTCLWCVIVYGVEVLGFYTSFECAVVDANAFAEKQAAALREVP